VSGQRLLCLVTDRRRLSPDTDPATQIERVVGQVKAAAEAGIDLVQIRERDLDARSLTALVRRAIAAAANFPARIVVNDRLDVALAAGAHGVHLRGDSYAVAQARQLGGDAIVVGRSVHSAEETRRAANEGAIDYVVLGTVFDSISKPGLRQPIGLGEVARACSEVTPPVLAIGGMTLTKAETVARAGAGIASIGLFIPPSGVALESYVAATVEAVRRTFDTCRVVPYH
jgi:thiamine-phosphate diphosphorylase